MDEWQYEFAERLNRAAIDEAVDRAHREAERGLVPENWDGLCIDYGEEVPPARVEATGSVLCVDCKSLRERRR